MGALNPWFLAAAVSLAVPVFLHLFHRRASTRVSFPALRYLERTEREHARNIRFRQLLLLMLRLGILAAVVASGARLFLTGPGSSHPPTGIVLVIDNSMSSGRVVGEVRYLDTLVSLALQSVERANPEDRFWILRAGEPWVATEPLDPARARDEIRRITPSDARGDLGAALARAREILATSAFDATEVHLLSDLQATAFGGSASPAPRAGAEEAEEIPVIVWRGMPQPIDNAAIFDVLVGRGLAPLLGEPTELAIRLGPGGGTGASMTVRTLVDGSVRAVARAGAGDEATVTLPALPEGWVRGRVEIDADPLAQDNVRYFAFRPRPAPRVAGVGEGPLFLREAVDVLDEAGRLRQAPATSADLLVAVGGEGLEARGPSTAALVLPDAGPNTVPALNERLRRAGVPWSYRPAERAGSGEAEVVGPDLPEGLEGVVVRRWLELDPVPDAAAPSRILAEVAGIPWVVETHDAEGRRILLLASPLDDVSSTLPTTTAWIRFLDWVAGPWAGAGGSAPDRHAGDRLPAPPGATHVRDPDGALTRIDGTRIVRATRAAGHYTFLEGDTVVSMIAVNPSALESDLRPLPAERFNSVLGTRVAEVDSPGAWTRSAFQERRGPELGVPFLSLALALLVLESLVAAGRRISLSPRRRDTPVPVADAPR